MNNGEVAPSPRTWGCFESQICDCDMIQIARQWEIQFGVISAAFLQRKLRVNYSKAMELINEIKSIKSNKK